MHVPKYLLILAATLAAVVAFATFSGPPAPTPASIEAALQKAETERQALRHTEQAEAERAEGASK